MLDRITHTLQESELVRVQQDKSRIKGLQWAIRVGKSHMVNTNVVIPLLSDSKSRHIAFIGSFLDAQHSCIESLNQRTALVENLELADKEVKTIFKGVYYQVIVNGVVNHVYFFASLSSAKVYTSEPDFLTSLDLVVMEDVEWMPVTQAEAVTEILDTYMSIPNADIWVLGTQNLDVMTTIRPLFGNAYSKITLPEVATISKSYPQKSKQFRRDCLLECIA